MTKGVVLHIAHMVYRYVLIFQFNGIIFIQLVFYKVFTCVCEAINVQNDNYWPIRLVISFMINNQAAMFQLNKWNIWGHKLV